MSVFGLNAGSTLVSIVMPSLNQARFISAALDSVLRQSFRQIELVVVDGGSCDGTLELLGQRAAEDSRVRWWSESDQGPADALNKGFSRARGTVLGWLNSDDLYTPGAIERAILKLSSQPNLLMVYGQGRHVDERCGEVSLYPTLPPNVPLERFADGCFVCQPTVFFKRSMWAMLGELDRGLKTAFDFEYWLRAFKGFPDRIGFVEEVQACSRLHEDCITVRMRRTVALESMRVLARHLGSAPKHWLLTYLEELLRVPTHARGVEDLLAHMKDAVLEVSGCLRPLELEALRSAIDGDSRLRKPGVFCPKSAAGSPDSDV